MIEALQRVISQLEQLSEEAQAKIAADIQARLADYQHWEADQVRVTQMSEDEFATFLAERKVSKPYLAPGYRGIYYSDEEFLRALGATDEELAELEQEG